MRNVLHELFDGKLSRDQMEYEKDQPYSRAYGAAVIAEEALLETLSDKQKAMFREFENALDEAHSIIRREDYAAGFQIGARIMMAVLDDRLGEIHQITE